MDKIKKGDCGYHYVELMACPSGCLNGGGQIRADGGIREQKERLKQLDALYHTTVMRDPADNKHMIQLYNTWIKSTPGSTAAKSLLHTQYHALAPPPGSVSISW
jgi:iron only hydrogenase large subunit-like protein